MNVAPAKRTRKPSKSQPRGSYFNPSLLKLALYCEGMRMTSQAETAILSGREIIRTRAGLGSGLELLLPQDIWTNVPVTEAFTAESPFELHFEDDVFTVRHPNGDCVPVKLAPRPTWYGKKTSSGKPMRQVGSLQGTYLGIYPTGVCEFWQGKNKENCKYCSIGLNLGQDDAQEKTVADVLEVVETARKESHITYVDFNTGHYEDESYLGRLEPLIQAVKRETGLLIGVQTPPHSDLSRYDKLREMGVNRVSFCFEIYDRARFTEVCPGKDRFYGLDRYLKTIEYCAELGKKQNIKEPWVTNGEIIAGLEPPESSIAAINHITSVGAIPTVCVFRPLEGTLYAELDPPTTDEMIPVFRRLYEACMEHNLPIGLAPNIHVSLVMLPEECAGLSPLEGSPGYMFKRLKLGVKKKVFQHLFLGRLKKRDAAREFARR